jgi:osmotically-inducible protein OsmY
LLSSEQEKRNMPQDQRNWRRLSRDWDDERDYGRGRNDDWRGESGGYRSRGYNEGRGGSSYGGGREDHDSRQDRDYQGTLRAGDYGRYEDEEVRSYPPRFQGGRRSNREYGEADFGGSSERYSRHENSRGYGERDYDSGYGSREYGRESGGPSREYSGYGGGSGSDRGGGFGTYTEDYERRYGSSSASGRYSPSGRDYGNRNRGWWDKATDEVSSWFGDEEAERRRRMDEHRGRGPKNYARSDERIREDVSDRLTDDPLVDASEIEVSVQGQEVTLSGTVSSRNEKRLAEECVESVSGVKNVQNNLRVRDRRFQPDNLSGSSGTFGGRSTTTM